MEPVILLENVSFQYANGDGPVFGNVSFSVSRGKCAVITGPAASGKTTLCYCLNGLVPQALEGELRGHISVLGKDPRTVSPQVISREVGLVTQDPETQIIGQSVSEDIAFGLRNYLFPADEIRSRVAIALRQVGLEGFEDRLTSDLSGGEKQRLAIAGILATNPRVLILDDPTSELDPAGRNELITLLGKLKREEGVTLMIIDKRPRDLAGLADSVFRLAEGKISLLKPTEGQNFWYPPTLDEKADLRIRSDSIESESVTWEVLTIKDLSFGYHPDQAILKHINLTVVQNDFIALVGHNGAGKTSLAKHMSGLIKAKPGTVSINKRDLAEMKGQQRVRSVGYVFQNPDHQFFESSVEKEIEYGLKIGGVSRQERKRRVNEMLEMTGLAPFKSRHPHVLSKGRKQLLCIASLAVLKPAVLIIDEPTTGLDQLGVETVLCIVKRLRADGVTIVVISHDMELVARHANRVIVMADGMIIDDGDPATLFSREDLILRAGLAAKRQKGEAV